MNTPEYQASPSDVRLGTSSSPSDQRGSRSPLTGFGIFKGFTSDKKLKDGSTPKRRGPKPDAKPALTRRQELNRQAQRVHRERKETYVKALEQEVLRLKETYGSICREKEVAREEVRQLRDLLSQHGIPVPGDVLQSSRMTPAATSSGSISGSYPSPSTAADTLPGHLGYPHSPPHEQQQYHSGKGISNQSTNVDQVGIDFVLALERPCMDHMQMLCVRSHQSADHVSGHVLMASCPPASHISEHPDVSYPHQASPEVPKGDLLKLLDLSAHLSLDGEITPVMAWAYLCQNPNFSVLTEKDVGAINKELLAKVHCYGFGAVLEEFEVRDALQSVLMSKLESMKLA